MHWFIDGRHVVWSVCSCNSYFWYIQCFPVFPALLHTCYAHIAIQCMELVCVLCHSADMCSQYWRNWSEVRLGHGALLWGTLEFPHFLTWASNIIFLSCSISAYHRWQWKTWLDSYITQCFGGCRPITSKWLLGDFWTLLAQCCWWGVVFSEKAFQHSGSKWTQYKGECLFSIPQVFNHNC